MPPDTIVNMPHVKILLPQPSLSPFINRTIKMKSATLFLFASTAVAAAINVSSPTQPAQQ